MPGGRVEWLGARSGTTLDGGYIVEPQAPAAASVHLFLPWTAREATPAAGASATPPAALPTPEAEIPDTSVTQYGNPNELTALAVDHDDTIWAGSHGGGLLRWDTRTGTYTRFTSPVDMPDDRVLSLAVDRQGGVWVGTFGGAVYLAPETTTWQPVLLDEQTPLTGIVRDIYVDATDRVWFALDRGGLRRRDPDGHWRAWLGAYLQLDGQHDSAIAVRSVGVGRPLTDHPVAGRLSWMGIGCAPWTAGRPGTGGVALVDATRRYGSCTSADLVRQAEAAGAAAVVMIWEGDVAASRDPGIEIPVVAIDEEIGYRLRDRLIAGETTIASVGTDGAPESIFRASAVTVGPDGNAWVGTADAGVLRQVESGSTWRSYSMNPPIKAHWRGGDAELGSLELTNTPRLALLGPQDGDLVWAGDACPGDTFPNSLTGRIALLRINQVCSTLEKLAVVQAQGAIAAIVFDWDDSVDTAWSPPAQIPAVQITYQDAQRMRALLDGGETIHVELPPRLTSDFVTDLATDSKGAVWTATWGGAWPLLGLINGGITVIPAEVDAHWQAHSQWRPVTTPFSDTSSSQDQIHSLAFDTAGNLWAATQGGLRELTTGGVWRDDTALSTLGGLPDDRIRALALDSGGDLWLASAAGLSRRATDGSWSKLLADRNLAGNWLTALEVDPFGDLWAATGYRQVEPGLADQVDWDIGLFGVGAGLSRAALNKDGWTTIPESTALSLELSRDGSRMLVGSTMGLSLPPVESGPRSQYGGAWFSVVESNGTMGLFVAAETPFSRSAGRISSRAALYGDGCPGDEPVQDVQQRIALVETSIRTRCRFGAQLLDAQAHGALAVLTYTTDPALPPLIADAFDEQLHTPSLNTDPASGQYIAARLRAGEPIVVTLASGLWNSVSSPGFDVFDIATDRGGNAWLAGVQSLDRFAADGTFTNFHTLNSGLNKLGHLPVLQAVAVDADDNKWIGTRFGGAARLAADNTTWTVLNPQTTNGGLPTLRINDVAVASDGDVWFASDGGVSRMAAASGDWQRFSRDSSAGALPSDDVRAIRFDGEGAAWFGTAHGAAHRSADGRTWRKVGGPAGPITDIAVDLGGDAWLATAGLGLTQLSRTDPGDDCATALPLTPGAVISTTLRSQADIDLYAIKVDKPFSRIELTISDPDEQLDLFLRHSCVGIGAGGRHIGAGGRHIGAGGRHIGAGGRHIGSDQRLVFDVLAETGTYYVDVRPRIGTQDKPISYRLRTGLTQVDLASRRTLILTDVDAVRSAWGLAADSPEYLDWLDSLRALQADATVGGLLITDLKTETNAAVRAAFTDWRANDDPAATNAKANALAAVLRDWIWDKRATDLPRLQYIVIAADDRVIPFQRLAITPPAIDTGWRAEAGYLADAGIDTDSTVGRALAANLILTDDIYAAPAPLGADAAPDAPELHLPELSVGRLAERPIQMMAAVDAFFQQDGAITLGSTLVAGAGAHLDASDAADRALTEAGLAAGARLRLADNSWTSTHLHAQLLDSRRDLFFAATAGSHSALDAPGGGQISPADVMAARHQLSGTLAVALASHAGLNLPGPSHGKRLDWPEAWLARGAAFVGPTSYAYGLDGELQYGEKLLTHFLRIAAQGDGRVLGDSLVAAKQDYLGDLGAVSPFHAATMAGTVLYGLPMARVRVTTAAKEPGDADPALSFWGAEASERSDTLPGRAADTAQEVDSATTPGLWAVTVTQTLPPLRRVTLPGGTRYDTLPLLQPWLEVGEAVQPQLRVDLPELKVGSTSLPARGVLWLGGDSTDEAGWRPWLPAAVASVTGAPQTAPAASLAPTAPVSLRAWRATDLVGEVLVGSRLARALYVAGQYDPTTGTERRWQRIDTAEYYSDSADLAPPAVREVSVSGGGQDVSATVSDASGVLRVVAVYRDAAGAWHAEDLARAGGERWATPLKAAVVGAVWVQAVDAAGNVAGNVGGTGRAARQP